MTAVVLLAVAVVTGPARPLVTTPWTLDRIEPPYAVLISPEGRSVDVPLAALAPGAREGDVLEGTWLRPDARRRHARLASLAGRMTRLMRFDGGVASAPAVGDRPRMSRRRTPDHFARRARREGYAARSVYKLDEIDRRAGIFRRGQSVLDLGSAPGSWLQYIAKAVGPTGRVVGVDLQPVTGRLPGYVVVHQADAFDLDPDTLGEPFDVVTSDMAPATTGNRLTDHVRSIELCRRALAVAQGVLRPGGAFVCKAFEGEDLGDLFVDLGAVFESVRRLKPKGTRSESVELFLVGTGFKVDSG